MSKIVKVRDLRIGEGRPKICVPIVGATEAEIFNQIDMILDSSADFVEWRIDYYEDVFNIEILLEILSKVREGLGDLPLLVTFRTKAEGGEKEISVAQYQALCLAVAQSSNTDLIDVECSMQGLDVKDLIRQLHTYGVIVVGSNHHFDETPTEEEIISRLVHMQELDADLPKIAVMPQDAVDVATLLSATAKMNREFADRPIITMSMGKLGFISRIVGQTFGSAVTFGAVGKASAPGQMDADTLRDILNALDN